MDGYYFSGCILHRYILQSGCILYYIVSVYSLVGVYYIGGVYYKVGVLYII